MDLAAIDCAAEENRKVCTNYSVKGYPTIKVSYEMFVQAHTVTYQIIFNVFNEC